MGPAFPKLQEVGFITVKFSQTSLRKTVLEQIVISIQAETFSDCVKIDGTTSKYSSVIRNRGQLVSTAKTNRNYQ